MKKVSHGEINVYLCHKFPFPKGGHDYMDSDKEPSKYDRGQDEIEDSEEEEDETDDSEDSKDPSDRSEESYLSDGEEQSQTDGLRPHSSTTFTLLFVLALRHYSLIVVVKI